MGRHKHVWTIGFTAIALATPWFVWSSPLERVPVNPGAERIDLPAVRLGFVEQGIVELPIIPPATGPQHAIESPKLPPEIPGADAAAPLPKFDAANPKAFEDALGRLFPPLPPAAMVMPFDVGPEGRPMNLIDLQRAAEANSPLLRQALAATSVPAGFCNLDRFLYFSRHHAKAVADADSELARIIATQIDAEVTAGVRRGYFTVLAAQEAMRVQEAFAKFTEDAYTIQVERARQSKVATTEPLQMRALAYQARVQLVQARNRYVSAWKQLAATIGRFDLQPTLLDGRIDHPLPLVDFETIQSCMLARNSELAAAHAALEKARSNVHRSSLLPFLIFHRGSLTRARAELAQAEHEPARVRASLTAQLADAYERYDNQRRILVYYRDHIIPDQARVYRALTAPQPKALERPAEIVASQQSLAASVNAYLESLGEAWFAVTDLAHLTQARDVFAIATETCGTQLTCLADTPSCPGRSAHWHWPEAMPTFSEPPAARGQRFVPTLPTALPSTSTMSPCLPCEMSLEAPPLPARTDPRPVTGSALVAPFLNIEKSTKRRRFFTWSSRRGDESIPLMLPMDEPAPCCPPVELPSSVIPKTLPQVKMDGDMPFKLPDLPVARTSTQKPPGQAIPLPTIIDGPAEANAATPLPTETEILFPKTAQSAAPPRPPVTTSAPLPMIIDGPVLPRTGTPATSSQGGIRQASFQQATPEPELATPPRVAIPPLRLPPLR